MNDTGKAKLPGLPRISTGNQALDGWIAAVNERLEVREGNRGNPFERVVLLRELTALGLDSTQWGKKTGTAIAGVMVQSPDGTFTRVPIDAFADEIRKTRLYRDLTGAIDDAGRFDSYPAQVKSLLLNSIAEAASQRGADIKHLENKLQSATESLASNMTEVTAAVQSVAAGVRQVDFAAAEANRATAGHITQVQARLDDVGGVTIEESMTATADRVTGLAGEFMVKITAGNAVAGFGLAASEDPSGATESTFIVEADKFALTSAFTFVSETTPSATLAGQTWYKASTKVSKYATGTGTTHWVTYTPVIPFGVDTVTGTVYINGAVKINSGGVALQDVRGPVPIYNISLSGLTAYPGRLGGKAKWSSSATLTEANAVTADTAATTALCTALGLTNSSASLKMGDSVTLRSDPGGSSWTTAAAAMFSSYAVYSVAYGSSMFIAAGGNGLLGKSTDGASWTAKTSSFGTSEVGVVAYGLGLFVIAGQSGKRAWSADGETWTAAAAFGAGEYVKGLAYGDGLWVAVGGAKVETSTDGKTWTSGGTVFGSETMYSVAYGNGIWVATGTSGKIYTSTNGTSWTSRTSNNTETIWSVTYGNGRFVAVDNSGRYQVNVDPTTAWPSPASIASAIFQGVCYGNGKFIAVGYGGRLYTSDDGSAWTVRTSGFSTTNLRSVCYGGEKFIATGDAGKIGYSSAPTAVAITGYWSGSAWLNPGVMIDGNAFISGTLSAGTGEFNNVLIRHNGYFESASNTITGGYLNIEVPIAGIGTPLWSWAVDLGSTALGASMIWTDNTETTASFRLFVWTLATGVGYTGSIGTVKIVTY